MVSDFRGWRDLLSNEDASRRPGALDLEYARGRREKRSLRYRLRRRTDEVCRAAAEFLAPPVERILDLGTADGRMLAALARRFPGALCLGVEYDPGLATLAGRSFNELAIINGDVERLPLAGEGFDLAVAAAVIEHLPDPGRFMEEVHRVLRPGGILVLTAPDPFWEEVAHRVGHLPEEVHHQVMNLEQLTGLARAAGLEVLLARKFMISPVGCPGELGIERVIRSIKLDFLLLNQLLVARRGDGV